MMVMLIKCILIYLLSYHKNNLHDPMSGGWGEVRA